MAHTYTNLLAHVIFSTKERRPFIDAELKPRLLSYMIGIMREPRGNVLGIDGTPDHVHLLVALPPAVSMADALRVLKTNSSRWVHDVWPQRRSFGWQTGYGAFSVSQSNVGSVLRYIAEQEEHHRRVSFKEEYVEFLKKHGIEYDERYIWD